MVHITRDSIQLVIYIDETDKETVKLINLGKVEKNVKAAVYECLFSSGLLPRKHEQAAVVIRTDPDGSTTISCKFTDFRHMTDKERLEKLFEVADPESDLNLILEMSAEDFEQMIRAGIERIMDGEGYLAGKPKEPGIVSYVNK